MRILVVFENSKRRSDNALTIIYLNVIFLEIKYESTFANFCYFPTPTWYLLLSALCLKK